MAENLTDVDQFDATISMPTSGETVSAADLRDRAVQKLANRTYNNKLRLDGIDDLLATAIRCTVSGTVSTTGNFFTLASDDVLGSNLTVASNKVTVADAGWYRVSLVGLFETSTGDMRPVIYNDTTATQLLRLFGVQVFGSSTVRFVSGTADFEFAASDTVGVILGAGSNTPTDAGTTVSTEGAWTYFAMERIG